MPALRKREQSSGLSYFPLGSHDRIYRRPCPCDFSQSCNDLVVPRLIARGNPMPDAHFALGYSKTHTSWNR